MRQKSKDRRILNNLRKEEEKLIMQTQRSGDRAMIMAYQLKEIKNQKKQINIKEQFEREK